MNVDPLTRRWSSDQVALMQQLNRWVARATELNLRLAGVLGLPSTDANALGHIVWAAEADEPLSPAELSRRVGMTTGAVSILLDRLENAGHIGRTRESSDRRRVTLRPLPDTRERVRHFVAETGREVAEVLSDADSGHLREAVAVITSMNVAATRGLARLSRP